jgi:prepilin-type processing-associated H-X9-DG protein
LRIDALPRPSETALFADAAQVNTFQAPASPDRPMLEEFYYISAYEATTHFRHAAQANVVFVDGHADRETAAAGSLDQRLPQAHVGRLRARVLFPFDTP